MEFGLDVGTLGPGPEIFFFLLFSDGLFEGEPLAFDVEALGMEFATAEPGNIDAEFAQAAPLFVGTRFGSGKGAGGSGIAQGKPMSQFGGGVAGERLVT